MNVDKLIGTWHPFPAVVPGASRKYLVTTRNPRLRFPAVTASFWTSLSFPWSGLDPRTTVVAWMEFPEPYFELEEVGSASEN